MLALRIYTLTVLAATLPIPAFAWQGSAVRPPQPRAQQIRPAGRQAAQNAPKPDPFYELMRMTQEEREKALSQLPPARRERIGERIRKFQEQAPAAQERQLQRLERLNSLPPREQSEVRRSTNQLKELPDDRKMAINREQRNMTGMTDDERQAYMNTEQFRNRYSAPEQEIIRNLAKILPKVE